jgi:hypothetical protein
MTWLRDTNEGVLPAKGMSPGARLVCFVLFVGAGLASFSAAVILPEYVSLSELQAQRDALSHQLECEKKLTVYNDRMIRAIQSDPVLAARLLMRHGNYRLADCETVQARSGSAGPSVPDRLLREAAARATPSTGLISRAGRWMDDRSTKLGLMLLAAAMVAAGMIFSAPPAPPDDA